jgi:hypothetical protein
MEPFVEPFGSKSWAARVGELRHTELSARDAVVEGVSHSQ